MKPVQQKPDYLDGDSDEVNGWRQYKQSTMPIQTMGQALAPLIAQLREQQRQNAMKAGLKSLKPTQPTQASTSAENSAKPSPGHP